MSTKEESVSGAAGTRKAGKGYHQRTYQGLLIFVVAAGLPVVSVPAARNRLKSRVEILRAAVRGERIPAAPVPLRVGDNREPFPKEYEHPTTRPDYLARLDLRPKQMHVVISDQGVVPAVKRAPVRIVVGSDDAQAGEKPSTQTSAGASEAAAAGAAGSDKPAAPAYQKGKGEQEAYDLLVSSSKALSEMLKGSNPALKFQDWGAAAMGENSYNVMVTFVQAAGDVPQKYIWNVKLSSKEVIPVNSLAMSISR